jgi:RNA 2',3'-cyclic 3'-phosphodiesterase
MRLFIAIDLDEAAREAIAEEQRRLKASIRSVRARMKWVRPEQMHLTLVFLGEVAEARVSPIIESIGQPIPRPPFDLAFGGAGVFPSRGAPNVLWVGALLGEAETIEVQRHLADRVAPLGFSLERRPFRPHLTLARLKDSRPADRTAILAAEHQKLVATTRVDHATLYQSKLSSQGSSYLALARATLSRSG